MPDKCKPKTKIFVHSGSTPQKKKLKISSLQKFSDSQEKENSAEVSPVPLNGQVVHGAHGFPPIHVFALFSILL